MAQHHAKSREGRFIRTARTIIGLAMILAVVGGAIWLYRDRLRSPLAIYREATTAKPQRAARLYAALARRMPELAEYCDLWSAQARLPAFEAVEALQNVARYRPDGPAAYHAHLALARYYASIESFQTDDEYLAALKIDDTVGVRLELARYLEAQNNPSAAYKQYSEILGPGRPDAFTGMRRTAPHTMTVARDLLDRGYCSDAVDALRTLDTRDAHCMRAKALRCLGLQVEAALEEEACEGSVNQELSGGTEDAEPESDLRSILSAKQPEEEEPSSFSSEELTDEERRLLNSDDPVDWWRATWDIDAAGRFAEVVPIYLKIAESDAYVSDDAAYRAWVLARRELQDPRVERTALSLLESKRLSWLGFRATDALTWAFEPDYPVSAVDALTSEVMRKVSALESIGLEDLAFQELRLTALVSETPEIILKMAEELSARGHTVAASSLAVGYVSDHRDAPRRFWEMAYPQVHADEVRLRAEQYDVEPELIWAIMRQESLFQPELVSYAGARGLMQIMGELQADACEQVGAGCEPGDAYRPGPNIHMGTWYLSFLMNRYYRDLDLVIMAYNAGPGTLDGWLKLPTSETREDLLRFVLFGETREYLERVSRDRLIYRHLYWIPTELRSPS